MRRTSDIALVPISGDLTAQTVSGVRGVIESLIDGGTHRIVLNMMDVPHVDAAGMAFILSSIRRMRECGGLISLINVVPDVMRVLRIARLVDIVPVSAAGSRTAVPDLDPSVMPLWRTTLPVNAQDLHATRARVSELAHRLPFSRDEIFDLTLAVGEAIGNATDHTCGEGVLTTISAYSDRIVVEVTDCGSGFDGKPSPCERGSERGRGISLMQLLVDSVRIERRPGGVGTIVRLVKLT